LKKQKLAELELEDAKKANDKLKENPQITTLKLGQPD